MGDWLYRFVGRVFGTIDLGKHGEFQMRLFTIRAARTEVSGLNECEQHEDFWYRAIFWSVPLPTYGIALRNMEHRFGWALLTWHNHSRDPRRWKFQFERTPL
jgi:hypothetical protein